MAKEFREIRGAWEEQDGSGSWQLSLNNSLNNFT